MSNPNNRYIHLVNLGITMGYRVEVPSDDFEPDRIDKPVLSVAYSFAHKMGPSNKTSIDGKRVVDTYSKRSGRAIVNDRLDSEIPYMVWDFTLTNKLSGIDLYKRITHLVFNVVVPNVTGNLPNVELDYDYTTEVFFSQVSNEDFMVAVADALKSDGLVEEVIAAPELQEGSLY